MIKTPVAYDDRHGVVYDANGERIFETNVFLISDDDVNELVKRINMHDELVKSLRDMFELAGKAHFDRGWKDRYKQVELLLERCK